jgi:signal transduction histidine kinase
MAMACSGFTTAAELPVPYQMDEHTLHLWHLDESSPPFSDSGQYPTLLFGLLHGATAAQPSPPGFGTSVSFNFDPSLELGASNPHGPILLAAPFLDNGPGDNVDAPFPIMGDEGAFTIEALVKLDVLPADSPGLAADIVSMDEEERPNRGFIFRIEKPGFLSLVPISGEFVRGGGLATIPTDGPHAMNTRDWFHVAVTYDGNETATNNLKLYWTKLTPGTTHANLIGRGTLTADINRQLGDFAIGNSGCFSHLGPFEFFPGCIDEVRISSIARKPEDFLFRGSPLPQPEGNSPSPRELRDPGLFLMLRQVLVGDQPVPIPQGGAPLTLGPGLHRLDFDFGFLPGVTADPLAVKCRLEGLDDDWQPTARGMTMTWEMLDEKNQFLARTIFTSTGSSRGWERDVLDSPRIRRSEPLFVPEATRKIQLTISSGAPDTTGSWVLDDFSLSRSSNQSNNLWANGDFKFGERMNQIGGIPSGWLRRGSEPAIARLILTPNGASLGLLDAAQEHSASWTSVQELKVKPTPGGETFLLGWSEAFNVISGTSLRATFINVPPGQYTFRAIGVSNEPTPSTTHLVLPVTVRQPFWNTAWFLPAILSAGVALVGLGMFAAYRRRARGRIAAVKLQHALERDRTRIARDMHDDLGTRISVLNLTASFVRRAIDTDPPKARRQVIRLETAARELVNAMEGLVWAVNPANDTLDHLAAHLSGMAHDLFRDSPISLRLSIPTDLPAIPLRSDFRHHFALGVKEALHNVLKHAGPCEVSLRLSLDDGRLNVVVADNGTGFDTNQSMDGNGLHNLSSRFEELGGSCKITSQTGSGTRVEFSCRLPHSPQLVYP